MERKRKEQIQHHRMLRKLLLYLAWYIFRHVNTSVNRSPCGSALGIIELLGKLAALYGIPVKDLTRLIVFQVVFITSGK